LRIFLPDSHISIKNYYQLILCVKNLPMVNLAIDDYANETYRFIIVNKTGSKLEELLNRNLKVNTKLVNQPFKYLTNTSQIFETPSFAGLVFQDEPTQPASTITLFYNDSAVLSVPYLLHELANLYSNIENTPAIQTRIASLPRIDKNYENLFDKSLFASLIVLGIGIVLPSVSFATEIVHDREVNKKIQ